MLFEVALAVATAVVIGFAYAKIMRLRLYGRLKSRITQIAASRPVQVGAPSAPLPDFGHRFAVIPDALDAGTFEEVRAEAERLLTAERSYLPAHKQGGTVAYETLIETSPTILSLYHSASFQHLIARVCGEQLAPTPVNDQSSLSVLFYTKPGDHIGWHYDHNFYRGRHFTVLLPLVNEGHSEGGLSHARLIAKLGEEERTVASPPNTLIVFEGAVVRHKVLPVVKDERRIVLSMTYCTNPSASFAQGMARRIKDVAFFGPRALWT
jgi:hypothetical protein